jgi:hypothetical protein
MALMPSDGRARPGAGRPALAVAAALAACCLLALFAGRAGAVPSAVVHYGPSLPQSLDQYAAPGNVIVVTAEQRNRNPARIRAWRAKGAIVMAYVNLVDYSPSSDSILQSLYGGGFPSAWFHPCGCSNYGGRPLLDLRASSAVATYNGFTGTWGQYAAQWIRNQVIKDGSLFNGVFLDVWGSRMWNVSQISSGPGSDWEAGVARWGQAIRDQVGPNIFLVGNNTQTRTTAAPLNGRMWESFDGSSPGYNHLTGQGEGLGLVYTFAWPDWHKPQLDILWRNEASPSSSTRDMLVSSANRVTKTGTDIAVGASDHNGGFPAPFGGGGGQAPPGSSVPAAPGPSAAAAPARAGRAGSGRARARRPDRLTLTARQLRINQRIGQAAIRRLAVVEARMTGRPVPRSGARRTRDRVRLDARQLRINQRIYQAGVRRATKLESHPDPVPAGPRSRSGRVRLSVRQLLINQRIAQAAVRRANALLDRVS